MTDPIITGLWADPVPKDYKPEPEPVELEVNSEEIYFAGGTAALGLVSVGYHPVKSPKPCFEMFVGGLGMSQILFDEKSLDNVLRFGGYKFNPKKVTQADNFSKAQHKLKSRHGLKNKGPVNTRKGW